MGKVTRPYEPRDRAKALGLLKHAGAIDSPGHHIVVTQQAKALALWLQPTSGDTGQLATIIAPVPNPHIFYELALAACQQAIDAGLTRGTFTIRQQALLKRILHDFRITAVPVGWEPNTGRPVQWQVNVDLAEARDQLRARLNV